MLKLQEFTETEKAEFTQILKKATQVCLEDFQDRIEVVFSSTHSPNLNWIEQLWRYLRGQITRNHFHVSLPQQCEQITAWLEHLSFEQLIQTLEG